MSNVKPIIWSAVLLCGCTTAATDSQQLQRDGGAPESSAETAEPPHEEPTEGEEPGTPDGGTADTPPTAKPAYAAISLGVRTGCVRLTDGTTKCWGGGGVLGGALGFAPTEMCIQQSGCPALACTRSPTLVPGLSNVAEIATSGYSACAVLTNQTVKCWGANYFGQLGYGPTGGTSSEPILNPTIVPSLDGVVQIALGGDHTCARISDGTVKCWGANFVGQLGFTSKEYCIVPSQPCTLSPTTVPGVSGVVQISADDSSTCALLADGSVKCWGDLTKGLGVCDASASYSCSTPPITIPALTNVVEIAGAGIAGCARLSDGAVVCWRGGTSPTSPTAVAGLGEPATALVAHGVGSPVACARLASGAVKCWGAGPILGTALSATAKEIAALTASTQFAVRFGRVCLIRSDGGLECSSIFATNCAGELGNGTNTACGCEE